jgi:NADH:ubiquinone oxidoreductase subunit 6 (subunit J)
MSLVFVVLGSNFILLLLKVEFLAYISMLVYIGAISILFLFIILVLQLDDHNSEQYNSNGLTLDNILYVFVFIKLCSYLHYLNKNICINSKMFSYEYTSTISLGDKSLNLILGGGDAVIFLNLFSERYLFFLTVGYILLFVMNI